MKLYDSQEYKPAAHSPKRLSNLLAHCRKNASRLLCGLLAGTALTSSANAARSVPVQVDGTHLPGQSYLEEGVTYVPLRYLLDAFGGWEILWDHSTQQAIAVSDRTRLSADPAENKITIDDETFSGRVTVENGRTYVPLRLIAEALDHRVEWDSYLSGAAVTSSHAVYNAVEIYWMSRIIYAESGAEPLEGQIAVGNVVLNRVASAEFPDSVPGVIFDQTNGIQFEPVENGTVYRAPSPRSLEAARQVLDGENTVGDAMYFYAPALSQGTWINANRTYLKTIGCHRFYL